MGNSTSYQDDDQDEYDKFDGIETLGYRVLGVQPNSPASVAGLVSFFDFLVGANGKMLLGSGEELEEGEEYDDVDLPSLLQENLGKEIELLVYNIKSQETRFVKLVPSKTWGGAGLLGVTIRMDNYGGADERLIRVLTVEHNSPAAIAGLVPEQDYLLGTVSESLDDTSTLAMLLQANIDRVVEFYVYNTDSDVVRVVALMPTWSWGGGGLLGAEVGTGYLHRLPSKSRNTSGQSVERKVRWVKGEGQPDKRTTTKANGSTGGQSSQEQQRLEVEPQLEIETEEGEPNSHATPQEVADMTTPIPTAASAHNGPPQATTKPMNGTTTDPEATPEPTVERPDATQTPGQEPISTGQPPLATKQVSPIDAAAVFAGPPPTQTPVATDEVDLR